MIIGLIFILIIYTLINFLTLNRIYKSIAKFKKINKKAFFITTMFISYIYIIYSLCKDFFPNFLNKILAFIGSYYLGFLFYAIILFIISYIISLLFRKKHIKIDIYIISLLLIPIILIIGTYMGYVTKITEYDIVTDKKLTSELKVAMISDLHLGDIIDNNRFNYIIDKTNSLNPDVILIAGDLVDSDLNPIIYKNMLSSLKKFHSKYGTYITLGNHDKYTNEDDKLTYLIDNEGATCLRNESILINNDFYIIGRDDKSFSEVNNGLNLSNIIQNLDPNKLTIVIDHTPSRIDESIDNNIDIQVSGHTHNGQLFPGNIITNSIFKLGYGYEKFKNTNVIVSSGVGTWGPPIRTTSQSEIVLLNIHN